MEESKARTRIVILGGGFAGAYCAQALRRTLRGVDADVLLIDHNNYFVFYPLLVEAGTGALEPRHVVVPLRRFLGPGTRLRVAEVDHIDPHAREVHYHLIGEERTRRAAYDHLVVALGSVTNLPPVPGLAEHAYELKTLGDSVGLRDRAVHLLELANATSDPAKRRALLRFVVVGGSYSGVEVAGEFNEFLRDGTRQYGNLSPDDVEITIVDLADRLLPALPESLARYATRELEKSGVRVRLGQSVARVRADRVEFDTGETLDAHTVVWCAGIAQPRLLRECPFDKDPRGYLLAEPDFRLKGWDNAWGIGDCAVNRGPDGRAYAATAQNAVRMGRHLAGNLRRAIDGAETKPFAFKPLGSLAPLGRGKAVAEIAGLRLRGFPAWWLWRTIYLLKMPGWGRRARVALDWTIELFFPRDYVQLGTGPRPAWRDPRNSMAVEARREGESEPAAAAK